MYLKVETLEGETLHITCSSTGFYVSRSTDTVFDPVKAKKHHSHHNLPDTLGMASPMFKSRFQELQKTALTSKHVYEYIDVPLTVGNHPWAVRVPNHSADAGRLLDAHISSLEVMDTLTARDWNDELQSLKELPRSTTGERLVREQALDKQHQDYVSAALKGSLAVAHKSLVPLNHLEPEEHHLYLHNHIFFSQGYDQREQFEQLGGPNATHVSLSKDIDGLRALNRHDLEGVFTLGTCMLDYKGKRTVAQTIVPGILKKTSAQEEGESLVQYGSIDGGKTISTNPEFETIASKIAESMHLEAHTMRDENGVEHVLHGSIESKGVVGEDGRKYF